MDLAGRHVVVTGAASGIGRACALRFADEDAKVTVADLDEPGAQRIAGEIGGFAAHADVGRESDITALIDQAQEHHGPIDVFFSNAGITGPSGGPEITDADWDLLWRVNVMSHIWAARALLPAMLQRGEGHLLSTASAAGLLTQLGAIGYSATKHAAVAVAEWIDITYRDQGIRVSCLCPQFVNTPMVTHGEMDVEKLRQIAQVIEPEQVADDVVEAMREERFLILPHPEVEKYMRNRGSDHERWLTGMRQLQVHLGGLGRAPE
jgi:NAD(P)-dependent dehydrogenase (short-subunit alcohol dehydrogenase family)